MPRGRWPFQYLAPGVGAPVGDGLLVAMDHAPDAKVPRGHSQVILTTYGLSDAAFDDLAQRWRTWWSERFDNTMPGC